MANEKDSYYMQENRRLEKANKELKGRNEYLEKKVKELKDSAQHDHDARFKEKNCIIIGGYGGISIPLDEVVKKQIHGYILKEIRKIIETDKDFEELFIKQALNYKDAFIRIFKPIVKDLIEDIDFSVSFEAEERGGLH